MNNDNKKFKVLENKIQFFIRNLLTYQNLRPKINLVFQNPESGQIAYRLEGDVASPKDDLTGYLESIDRLKALNTAIVLNCFSIFEASFEALLLKELDTKNLTGIQEKVMLKYIEGIIRLSSHLNYAKEYKFITGQSIKETLSKNEYQLYELIVKFYTLRHRLVHGSSTKIIFIDKGDIGQIELDADDVEYQELLNAIKSHLGIKVSSKRLSLDILLSINEVTDLLSFATLTISTKFYSPIGTPFKFVKENIFEVIRSKRNM